MRDTGCGIPADLIGHVFEALVATALRRVLTPEHEVVTLSDGREALRRIAAGERFDVILCDLMMPEMSGMSSTRSSVRRPRSRPGAWSQ